MIDFTSALYLGLRHPHSALAPWAQLTNGRPAALGTSEQERDTARRLARWIGCTRVALAPSTLHLFWDICGQLDPGSTAIYVDAGAYPIARWGCERAAARGVSVRTFRHFDARQLRRHLERRGPRRGPVVITDGICPDCGRTAPLPGLNEIVADFEGLLVIDDTQAMGILGEGPSASLPYGCRGGGSLRYHALDRARVISISSLAKGFGVPLAILGGGADTVSRFVTQSDTQVHCSPPSAAAIAAADHALAINARIGDELRTRLLGHVRHFRDGLRGLGCSPIGGLFPVQSIPLPDGVDGTRVYDGLLRRGVRGVLRRSRCRGGTLLSLLITARHTPEVIDWAANALAEARSCTENGGKVYEVAHEESALA